MTDNSFKEALEWLDKYGLDNDYILGIIRKALQADEWRDISTAPKGETPILAYNGYSWSCVIYKCFDGSKGWFIYDADTHEKYGTSYDVCWSACYSEGSIAAEFFPTHWKPLDLPLEEK